MPTSNLNFKPATTRTNSVDAQPSISSTLRYLPLTFFLTYLGLTVALFAFGPWDWPIQDGTKLYLFLFAAHLSLAIGYLSAARSRARGYRGRWRTTQLVLLASVVSLLLLWPTAAFRSGTWLPDIAAGITSPGEAYARANEARDIGTPTIEYVRFFAGPILILVLPLTVFYWSELPRTARMLGTISVLGVVMMFVAIGTNKALADFVLLMPWLVLAGAASGRLHLGRMKSVTITIVMGGLFLLFLLFFAETQYTREGSSSKYGLISAAGVNANYDGPIIRRVPDLAAVGILGITNYAGIGYYALYLSLDEPFVPTFGFGNSYFTLRQVQRVTGDQSFGRRPYPMRIERRGWDAYGLFSSIYPWIASDLTFPGTLVFVFLIGRLLAIVWHDTLLGENPLAVVVFSQLLIMLYYFPANNQLLQSGEGYSAFWITLLWWFLVRARRRPVWRHAS